jgi:anti-anti-sigma factor
MQLTQRTVGDVVVVGLEKPTFIEFFNADEFRSKLQEIVESSPRVLLDFSNITDISSKGLGALISLLEQVKQKNGSFRLFNMKKKVAELFSITKLDAIFEIFESEESALATGK